MKETYNLALTVVNTFSGLKCVFLNNCSEIIETHMIHILRHFKVFLLD